MSVETLQFLLFLHYKNYLMAHLHIEIIHKRFHYSSKKVHLHHIYHIHLILQNHHILQHSQSRQYNLHYNQNFLRSIPITSTTLIFYRITTAFIGTIIKICCTIWIHLPQLILNALHLLRNFIICNI